MPKKSVVIPPWLVPKVMVIYRPERLISRYDGQRVEVMSVNKYGQVTIRFLDKERKNQTRGVFVSEVEQMPSAS